MRELAVKEETLEDVCFKVEKQFAKQLVVPYTEEFEEFTKDVARRQVSLDRLPDVHTIYEEIMDYNMGILGQAIEEFSRTEILSSMSMDDADMLVLGVFEEWSESYLSYIPKYEFFECIIEVILKEGSAIIFKGYSPVRGDFLSLDIDCNDREKIDILVSEAQRPVCDLIFPAGYTVKIGGINSVEHRQERLL